MSMKRVIDIAEADEGVVDEESPHGEAQDKDGREGQEEKQDFSPGHGHPAARRFMTF
jgi:hypothetical protein